jgi:hypothetical protein
MFPHQRWHDHVVDPAFNFWIDARRSRRSGFGLRRHHLNFCTPIFAIRLVSRTGNNEVRGSGQRPDFRACKSFVFDTMRSGFFHTEMAR